ncbi:MAG: DNA polymerase I, partial [Pirellulaceae bacterium]
MKKNREKSQQKTLALFPEDEIDQLPPISRPPELAEKNDEVELDFSDLSGKTVFVLDSHSLIYQVFHAIGEMTGPDGRAVNALFGFTRDLLDIFSKWKPDFLFAAFDFSDTTFRNEIYPDY